MPSVLDLILHIVYVVDACSLHITYFLHCPWQIWCIYTGEENDAGVGSGCRRRLLDWYGFRFPISLWKVFEIVLCESVVFSVVQRVLWKFDVYCAYLSHLNHIKPSCTLTYPRVSLGYVTLRYVTLQVHAVRFVSFRILFFTLHIP